MFQKFTSNNKYSLVIPLLTLISFFFFSVNSYASIPVMSADSTKCILQDVFSCGGSTRNVSGTPIKDLFFTAGQQFCITSLVTGTPTKELLNGYFCMDISTPALVTDLTAVTGIDSLGNFGIILSWTFPYDDDGSPYMPLTDLTSGQFRIDYTTYTENYTFDINTYDILVTTTMVKGSLQKFFITGLTMETTYYFRLWSIDFSGNCSDMSNLAEAFYCVPPSPGHRLSCYCC